MAVWARKRWDNHVCVGGEGEVGVQTKTMGFIEEINDISMIKISRVPILHTGRHESSLSLSYHLHTHTHTQAPSQTGYTRWARRDAGLLSNTFPCRYRVAVHLQMCVAYNLYYSNVRGVSNSVLCICISE